MVKDCPPDQVFYLASGGTLKNLDELVSCLENLDDGTFKYHVNDQKNDFANWIRHTFKRNKLADDVQNVLERSQLVDTIKKAITKKSSSGSRSKKSKSK